jgi:hypothetical protein
VSDIEAVWTRIVSRAGEAFHLKRGAEFTYEALDNAVVVSRVNQTIYRSQFELALEKTPLDGPGDLSRNVWAPSYVFAIIMDDRIRAGDW